MKRKIWITFVTYLFCCGLTALYAQSTPKVEVAFEELNEFINVRDVAISTAQDEVFFTIQSAFGEIAQIAYMKKTDGKWSKPELMPFSDRFSDLEPFLAADQRTLYFASNRPLSDTSSAPKDFDIWYVKRSDKNAPWGKPVNLGAPVNSEHDEFYPTVALNNNLYFTMDAPSGMGKDDIYFSEYKNGTYGQPQLLDSAINSDGYEFNAFISQNEDFLIFTKFNNEGGLGSGDLYISRRDSNNKWTQSENLGPAINTRLMEYCPYYDQENSILYFTSRRKNFEPKKFATFAELQQYMMDGENGLSKIYKMHIKLHD